MQIYYHRNVRESQVAVTNAPKRGSWIRVIDPDHKELSSLSADYGLEIDLLEDGVDLYEAPRLERGDGSIYMYVRYCRPSGESTSTHPLLIVITDTNIITIERTESEPLDAVARNSQIVTTQKVKLVLNILEEINAEYRTHLNLVTKRILATRSKLRATIISNKDILNFVDIEEDLNEFLAALQPYGLVLQALIGGKYIVAHSDDEDLIEDLQLSTSELIELTKSRLKTVQNTRDAYTAIATNNLNQIFKRLTSIAIFMSIPTIVGGFYGMNVALPYDHHPQAFWIVSGLTISIMLGFVAYFRSKRWL
jgi:magnesium transporter